LCNDNQLEHDIVIRQLPNSETTSASSSARFDRSWAEMPPHLMLVTKRHLISGASMLFECWRHFESVYLTNVRR